MCEIIQMKFGNYTHLASCFKDVHSADTPIIVIICQNVLIQAENVGLPIEWNFALFFLGKKEKRHPSNFTA